MIDTSYKATESNTRVTGKLRKISFPDRDGWLELRKQGNGGSDAAAVAGLSPWSSPLSVYADKHGLVPEREDNEPMRQGRDLEEYVAQRFVEKTGLKVRRENHILINEATPFMLANIDRRIVGKNIGLECKTTSVYNKSDFEGGEVPPYYYVQCQHYMAVTGWDAWYLAVLVMNKGFYTFLIQRNEDDIQALIEMERVFWEQHVVKQIPPEASENDSDLLVQLYPNANDIFVPLEHMAEEATQLMQVKARIKDLEDRKKGIENLLKSAMGEASTASSGGYDITWKNRVSNRFDTTAFKKAEPDLYKQYVKESSTRTFIVKESKRSKDQEAIA